MANTMPSCVCARRISTRGIAPPRHHPGSRGEKAGFLQHVEIAPLWHPRPPTRKRGAYLPGEAVNGADLQLDITGKVQVHIEAALHVEGHAGWVKTQEVEGGGAHQ